MVAGGQESMSNVPYYVKREPLKYGGNMMIVRKLFFFFKRLFRVLYMNKKFYRRSLPKIV